MAYAAMQRRFFDPRSGDYRDTTGGPVGSHAWPFSQALAATLAVAPLERPRAHMGRGGGVPWTTTPGEPSRNTVSTANAAVLGLRLYLLDPQAAFLQSSTRMLSWLDECLLAPNGLFWDSIGTDGTVDRSEWSYNQGSVMEAYRLLYVATGNPSDLARAELVADSTLAAFSSRWSAEPAEFAVIFFRRLLDLAALDGRADYVAAAQAYADRLWRQRPHSLLQQAAVVQLYAALATDRLARRHRQPG